MHDIDSFGIGGADANVAIADSADFANVSEGSTRESTVLTSTASRDISQGIEAIEAEEEAARMEQEKQQADKEYDEFCMEHYGTTGDHWNSMTFEEKGAWMESHPMN